MYSGQIGSVSISSESVVPVDQSETGKICSDQSQVRMVTTHSAFITCHSGAPELTTSGAMDNTTGRIITECFTRFSEWKG